MSACLSVCMNMMNLNNHSAKLDQMKVHGLQPPHEHLHRLTQSWWPVQVKDKLWLNHLHETYERVRNGGM